MPPLVFHPILRTAQVTAFWQRGGRQRRHVLHYNYGALTPSAGDLNALLVDVHNSIYGLTGIPTITNANTSFYQLTALDVDHPGGAEASIQFLQDGLNSNATLPGNCAFVLTKRTGISNRSTRGRIYLGDLPEVFFDDDNLNGVFIPALTLIANHLLAGRNGGQFKPAVGSRALGLSTLITNITFDFTADSQRRRLTGRGI